MLFGGEGLSNSALVVDELCDWDYTRDCGASAEVIAICVAQGSGISNVLRKNGHARRRFQDRVPAAPLLRRAEPPPEQIRAACAGALLPETLGPKKQILVH